MDKQKNKGGRGGGGGNAPSLTQLRAEKALLEEEVRSKNDVLRGVVDRLRTLQLDVALALGEGGT